VRCRQREVYLVPVRRYHVEKDAITWREVESFIRAIRSPDGSIPFWIHLGSKEWGATWITRDKYLAVGVQQGWTNTGGQAALFIGDLDYGTYEWVARIVNPTANRYLYVGLSEKAATIYRAGEIFALNELGSYKLKNRVKAAVTSTTLVGQDWTTERKFKIVFSSAAVELYVDGSLVAKHTTNIPSPSNLHIIFIEAWQGATADTTDGEVYAKGWKKTA